jgi:hypothetical protein
MLEVYERQGPLQAVVLGEARVKSGVTVPFAEAWANA